MGCKQWEPVRVFVDGCNPLRAAPLRRPPCHPDTDQSSMEQESATSADRQPLRFQMQPPARKPRRYLRKADLCIRYGWKTTLSVDRAWKLYGSLPPPTTWQMRSPLWAEDVVDAHDAANALRERTSS